MTGSPIVDRPPVPRDSSAAAEVVSANLQMNNVQAAFAAVNIQGVRQYYECGDPPTQLTGLAESHFKGVARFGNKLVFAHTDIDPVAPASNGRYLIGDVIPLASGGQGTIEVDEHTPHQGWCHPCGIQACGSFMAMGIQASASGSGSQASEIQIFDIRNVLINQPAVLLGVIERPQDGVNGVAMTKESGDDGRYVVAAVNGNTLNVYRSRDTLLLPPNSAAFDQIPVEIAGASFPDSGAGLALITQVDGAIFLVSMNADDDGSNSLIGLYRLEVSPTRAVCTFLSSTPIPVPGMTDSVTALQAFLAGIPVIGHTLAALMGLLGKTLNSSFRWGKGLSITSADSFEIYATDRNVLPLSKIKGSGSTKDFGLVVWTGSTAS